jgi:AcrR family transcriptional regulator
MNSASLTPKYASPLRAEQKEATRQRILDAAGHLMEDRGLEDFSFGAIAKAAQVQEHTVYRHFPTKHALVEGLCAWHQDRARYDFGETEAALVAAPQRSFPGFAANEQLTRALWASPQGRTFRMSNVEARKRRIKSAIADAVQGMPPKQAKWIAAVVHVLSSSATWLTMKDYWKLSPDDAGKASSMAIELLLNAVRTSVPPAAKYKKK